MSFQPRYEKYEYTARGASVRAQSIVECRLADWSGNMIISLSGESDNMPQMMNACR